MKITMIGVGYVGLVSGAGLAELGHQVCCMDLSSDKISALQKGHLPIYEQGLQELVKEHIASKRLIFTTDFTKALEESPVIFIAVGTPMGDQGEADLSSVYAVSKKIGELMTENKLVVIKSTVPAGTNPEAQRIIQQELQKRQVPHQVQMASNPEFLREGTALGDFLKPDRIVVGSDSEEAKKTLKEIYAPLEKQGSPILWMDTTSAEVCKYSSNAMLAVKISFINEMSKLCEKVGADITHVREAMGYDPRIGSQFLNAGIGYGGCCLPKDVKALAYAGQEKQLDLALLKATDQVNQEQKKWFAQKILAHYPEGVTGKTFALWGLSFKPNTDDIREAPALFLIETLTTRGAQVKAYDPKALDHSRQIFADNPRVHFAQNAEQALEGADALILATEWMEFRQPNFSRVKELLKSPTIFDGRNQYDPKELQSQGFHYTGVGR